jgi:hypothetical protein
MELIDIRSTLIDIFPVDAFDFLSLMTDSFSTIVTRRYGCRRLNVQTPSGTPGLVYSLGSMEINGKVKIIDRIVIEERRVIVTIGGSSADAKVLMNNVIDLIATSETRHEICSLKPLIEIHEAQCTVNLGFTFSRLLCGSIANTVPDSLQSLVQLAPSPLQAEIVPSGLRFKIRYLGESDVLKNHLISMADKYLSIEMREGTSPESHIFFASAPMTSEALLDLLRSLERRISREK